MPFDLSRGAPKSVAIIGGGIAGLSAAWLLSEHHNVTVFEASARMGGHARTVIAGNNRNQPVDTGFIVFNYANYPHLTGLFRDLDVPVQKSDMSFGVSLRGGQLEYALRSAGAIYAQRRNILSPGFHRMIRDILRFNATAEDVCQSCPQATIAELTGRMNLSERFTTDYLYPLCGAIWSTPLNDIADFPAQTLLRFLRNHALMSRGGQHQWWTVSGGSISYVSRLSAALEARGARLRTKAPVRAIRRDESGVLVRAESSTEERFDQIILACHADDCLSLLSDPTPSEQTALGRIRFQPNRMVLHRDEHVMPRRRACWSSWVVTTQPDSYPGRAIGVSYWMNRLQSIAETDPMFVTLNPERRIRDDMIYDEKIFRHPVFDRPALEAQSKIASIQGENHTWYAGAWLRNGFHEDGFASAVRIARRLLPEKV